MFLCMNLTPQWLAVSSGPLSRFHLVWRRSGLPRWDNTVRQLLCDSHVSVCLQKTTLTFTFSVTWSSVSIYRTEMDWFGYSEGAWVWVGSAWFFSVRSTSFWCRYGLQQMAHYLERVFWGGGRLWLWPLPSVWNSGTGEDVWLAGG